MIVLIIDETDCVIKLANIILGEVYTFIAQPEYVDITFTDLVTETPDAIICNISEHETVQHSYQCEVYYFSNCSNESCSLCSLAYHDIQVLFKNLIQKFATKNGTS